MALVYDTWDKKNFFDTSKAQLVHEIRHGAKSTALFYIDDKGRYWARYWPAREDVCLTEEEWQEAIEEEKALSELPLWLI